MDEAHRHRSLELHFADLASTARSAGDHTAADVFAAEARQASRAYWADKALNGPRPDGTSREAEKQAWDHARKAGAARSAGDHAAAARHHDRAVQAARKAAILRMLEAEDN